MSEKSFLDRVNNVPIWVFFVCFALPVLGILFYPVGLATPSEPVVDAAIVNLDKLKPGDVVCWAHGAGAMSWPISGPTIVASLRIFWEKDVKVVNFCFEETGVAIPMLKAITDSRPEDYGKVYGEDYVIFGFVAGQEVALASFASDVWKTYPVDYYGNPIETLPIMQEIKNAEDIDLVITNNTHAEYILWAIRQFNEAYDIPIIVVGSYLGLTQMIPFYPAQLVGIIPGIEGGAILEKNYNMMGQANALLDGKAVGTIIVIIFFVFANSVAFARKLTGKD